MDVGCAVVGRCDVGLGVVGCAVIGCNVGARVGLLLDCIVGLEVGVRELGLKVGWCVVGCGDVGR